ncbi:MAG TPA: type II toxin-antitoxin system RelE/ParE family toxin [Candidatus Acidoferrales bacterium]|nr:type II toxin-antitoxin system RelE/ParE family toxin [Candidatus Acidoferrales bacterium]
MPHARSTQADSDLDDIWYYIAAETSADIADRVIDGIVQRFLLLAKYPRIGRTRDEIRRELRSFPVGEYVVFYRIEREDVIILRVLHGKRDIERILESE